MLKNKSIVIKNIFAYFNQLQTSRFTGSLIVKGGTRIGWKFYFRLGRLLWVSGGHNFQERWQRHLAVLCPQITPQQLEDKTDSLDITRDYTILSKLHKQGSPAEKKQIGKLIVNVLSEACFDIIQYINIERKNLSYRTISNDKLDSLIVLVDLEKIHQKTKQAWNEWVEADLALYSPNLFPIIQDYQKYQKEITTKLHPNLISLINGKYSLRALAAISKEDLIPLTRTLLSLMSAGFIAFSPTPKSRSKFNFSFSDFKELLLVFPESEYLIKSKSARLQNNTKPLIVCIDDSPIVGQALGKFMSQQGYRFISIRDPMNALSILLKNPPNLIFLDLMMPIINGYELCSQLRRAPNLKNVPIVILTSKDGLVDRVRAKLVGGNSFLTKPVTRERVLEILDKYLKVNSNSGSDFLPK